MNPFALLGVVPLRAWAALAVLAALVGWGWSASSRASNAETKLAALQKSVSDREAVAAAMAQLQRAREEAARLKKEAADHDLEVERKNAQARLAAERVGAGRLREQLQAATAGPGSADDDSLAACRQRASATGDVLADVLRDLAERTGSAEDHAAGVRALLGGWPK